MVNDYLDIEGIGWLIPPSIKNVMSKIRKLGYVLKLFLTS